MPKKAKTTFGLRTHALFLSPSEGPADGVGIMEEGGGAEEGGAEVGGIATTEAVPN